MAYIRTSGGGGILTTAEAKTSTRIDASTEDTLVDEYVSAGTNWVERQWDLALIDTVIAESFDEIPESGILRLTCRPVGATTDVTSVKYYDEDNAQQTFSSANYVVTLEGDEALIQLTQDASWPTVYTRKGVWVVTYTAGFGATAASVPMDIKTAVRMCVWDLYEMRGSSPKSRTIDTIEALLNPYIKRRA